MATGDNIRRHRKAKGFTQAQLADAVGPVSYTHLTLPTTCDV